ncbi:MAG: flagellar motor switch protein FliN [Legionellales bacterium]|nr:flagellar motor switch protein FliN [Legionellales bacterium]|tara:strand:- start:650 stop:979 length:330 start_codon:yes stop_codon:yes gene_type:complete
MNEDANEEIPIEDTRVDSSEARDESIDQKLIQSIPVTLTAELGSTKIKLGDLLRLAQGSVLELDREAGEMLDLKVNDTIIAKGEVVNVGDNLGLSIIEIVSPMDRIRPR